MSIEDYKLNQCNPTKQEFTDTCLWTCGCFCDITSLIMQSTPYIILNFLPLCKYDE